MDDMQDYPTLGRQRSPTRGDRRSPSWDETTPHEPPPARISSQPETTPRTTLDQSCDKGVVPGDNHGGDAVPASQETGSNGGIGAAARSAHPDHTDCATPRSHSPAPTVPTPPPGTGRPAYSLTHPLLHPTNWTTAPRLLSRCVCTRSLLTTWKGSHPLVTRRRQLRLTAWHVLELARQARRCQLSSPLQVSFEDETCVNTPREYPALRAAYTQQS